MGWSIEEIKDENYANLRGRTCIIIGQSDLILTSNRRIVEILHNRKEATYMRGWNIKTVIDYCQRKGWGIEELR